MKDKATEWLMGLNPFDKVKGHTKIELTDIHTGKKQIIEKDNAFQAGVLAQYMRSMGAYNNNPYANSTWAGQPIWRNLCGGILCFRDAIDNSEDEVEYMPAGNEMVANGAYMVNNAGTPIELGSYNEVESSTSGNDSVTFVYDWMTSQGNGTISCVCLTTEIGGYIGYGNKSGVATGTKKNLNANQSSRDISSAIYDNNAYSFTVDNSTQKVTVTKTPIEISKGSIFDNIAEDSFEIAYSTALTFTTLCAVCYIGNGKFLLAFHSGSQSVRWNNGATVYMFLMVDVVNKTATAIPLTNNTGSTMELVDSNGMAFRGADDTEVYFTGVGWNSVYGINYVNGQSTTRIVYEGAAMSNQSNYTSVGKITPDLTYGHNNNSQNPKSYIIDKVANTALICNALNTNNLRYNDNIDALSINSGAYKNPLILATINNLDSPVTKTAAQTMKITYTLSKASE